MVGSAWTPRVWGWMWSDEGLRRVVGGLGDSGLGVVIVGLGGMGWGGEQGSGLDESGRWFSFFNGALSCRNFASLF